MLGRIGLARRFGLRGGALGRAGTSDPIIPGVLTARTGTFIVLGVDMDPVVDTVFTAGFGAFPLTGFDTAFVYTRALAADVGTFALTGNAVGLVDQQAGLYAMAADTGTFALTGIDATLTKASGGLSKGIYYNTGYQESNVGATSKSFTTVALGVADAQRRTVIVVGIRSTNVITGVAVTIDLGGGAQSMTLVQAANSASAAYTGLFEFDTSGSAATTATVVVSATNAWVRVCADSYSVITSQTAVPTGAQINTSAAANPSASITNLSGGAGAIVASCCAPGAGASATPTGYTEDHDGAVAATTTFFTCGHDSTPASGAKTYTITWSAAPTGPNGVFATWG